MVALKFRLQHQVKVTAGWCSKLNGGQVKLNTTWFYVVLNYRQVSKYLCTLAWFIFVVNFTQKLFFGSKSFLLKFTVYVNNNILRKNCRIKLKAIFMCPCYNRRNFAKFLSSVATTKPALPFVHGALPELLCGSRMS